MGELSDEFDYTGDERINPCMSDAERPTGRPATTADRTSTASASESRTPTTGGTESPTTAVSGPSGPETAASSRPVTGANTVEPSRGSTPPETAQVEARLRDLLAGSREVVPYKAGDKVRMPCPRARGGSAIQHVDPLNWNSPERLYVYCDTTGCIRAHYTVAQLPKRYRVPRAVLECEAVKALPDLLDRLTTPPAQTTGGTP